MRGVGAGAGDHRHAAGGVGDDGADNAEVLLVGHRGRLAGGADGHQAVDPPFDLEGDEFLEAGVVNLALGKGRYERSDRAGERAEFHGSRQ